MSVMDPEMLEQLVGLTPLKGSPLHFINSAYMVVTEAPEPATTGTLLRVVAGTQLPTLPTRAFVVGPGEAAQQTNTEVLEITEAPGGGQLRIRREVEGPMKARAIKAGDIIVAGAITAGTMETMSPAPVTVTGTIYVSPQGDDANSGLSWREAKRTCQAANDALPPTGEVLASGKPVRNGRVELGAATGTEACPAFQEASVFKSQGFVQTQGGNQFFLEGGKRKKLKGSPYVEVNLAGSDRMKGCSAADIGCVLVNPLAPAKTLEAAEITDFWEGEVNSEGWRVNKGEENPVTKKVCTATKQFYTIDKAISKHTNPSGANPEGYFYVVHPAVSWSPGVQVRGRGPMGSAPGVGRKGSHAGTVYEDTGNAMTFWLSSGSPKKPSENRNYFADFFMRTGKRAHRKEEVKAGFTAAGKYTEGAAIWGWFVNNSFGGLAERLRVYGYTGWGCFIGNNAGSDFRIRDSLFFECGNEEAKIGPGPVELADGVLTGGIFSEGGTPTQVIDNVNCLNHYGVAIALAGGRILGGTYNHSVQSKVVRAGKTKFVAKSGTAILLTSGVTPSLVLGVWAEGSTVQINCASGLAFIAGCHFQGIPGEELPELEEEDAYDSKETYNQGEVSEFGGSGKSTGVWESLKDENVGHLPEVGSEWWAEVAVAQYAIEGGCIAFANYFRKYSKACIKELGGEPIYAIFNRIAQAGSLKRAGIPFIERQGRVPNIGIEGAWGFIRTGATEELHEAGDAETIVGAASSTTPPFAPKADVIKKVGGAWVYTNSEAFDIDLYVSISFSAAGTLEHEQSVIETWSQIFPPIERSSGKESRRFELRSGETLKLTPSGGAAVVEAVVLKWR